MLPEPARQSAAEAKQAGDLTPALDLLHRERFSEALAYLVYAGKAAEAVKLMTAAAGDLTDPAAEAEVRLSLAHLSMQYASDDMVEQRTPRDWSHHLAGKPR